MAGEFAALDRKLGALADALDGRALTAITTRVAKDAKDDALKALRGDVGGDQKMSNWRPKLNARYDVTGPGEANVKPTPSGPWKVLDEGAKPHTIKAKRRNRSSVLRTPYGPRRSVRHPGTRGKGTWDEASNRIARETPKRVHIEVRKALGRVFGG
jgi:hypothetical protein